MKKNYKKLFSLRKDRRSKCRSVARGTILSQKEVDYEKLLRLVRTPKRPSMEVLCLYMQHMLGIEISKASIRKECCVDYFTAIRMMNELDAILKIEPKLGYMRYQPNIPDDFKTIYLQ